MQKAQAVITDRREHGLFSANSSPSAREGVESRLTSRSESEGAESPKSLRGEGVVTEIQPKSNPRRMATHENIELPNLTG